MAVFFHYCQMIYPELLRIKWAQESQNEIVTRGHFLKAEHAIHVCLA